MSNTKRVGGILSIESLYDEQLRAVIVVECHTNKYEHDLLYELVSEYLIVSINSLA